MIESRHIYYRLLVAVLMLLPALAGVAQVDAQFTQYWAAPAYYNPAAVGRVDSIHITAGSRAQWVGIRKAPLTFLGMADMPFKLLNKRWGTGVVLQQQSMGLYSSLNVGAQIAYKQKLFKGTLTVGAQVGFIRESFKGDSAYIPDQDQAHTPVGQDEAIPQNTVTGNALDFGLGLFYQHKWFWVGASVAHLFEPSVTLKTNGDAEKFYEFQQGRIYYFMAGSNIPIKNTLFEIQPSIFAKTDAKFFQGEATLRVRYKKFISGGIGYRYKDAVSLMIGAEFKNFFLGYSYDYATSAISKVSSGSHEVFLNYNVKLNLGEKNKNKHKSIRLM
ncbi:MAG: PorP/SprF family type IX secretion system membrane protein [Muribaculaceae bacterium]|nr:PorP/SprF family type IX secretion system membrane protein [Muribaculaceae bacterium]MBQ5465939.1 PorP/SprF family type IX secretion system membrane protein [Muribaculaceae bacterium]